MTGPSPDRDGEFETVFAEELSAVPAEQFDRSQFVPGVGPLDAAVVLVGEAPGAREVEAGRPFVGPAGKLLDRELEELGVDRSALYITNVVKVRPPENRTPYVAEIDAWRPLLEAELERISPEVVVPLGTTAARVLLDTDEGIAAVQSEKPPCTCVPNCATAKPRSPSMTCHSDTAC